MLIEVLRVAFYEVAKEKGVSNHSETQPYECLILRKEDSRGKE